jgi:signal transduction histidine kinase
MGFASAATGVNVSWVPAQGTTRCNSLSGPGHRKPSKVGGFGQKDEMARASPSSPGAAPRLLPIAAGALAIAIFYFDSVIEADVNVGVLYVGVVLMAMRFCRPRGVIAVAVGCAALTVVSNFLSPGDPWASTALINRLIGIIAIAVTTFIALQNQSATAALQRAKFDRVTRLTTLGELTATIAHEVSQPLAAIKTNGAACMRWLAHQPPELDEARQAVERIVNAGNRANEILQRIRGLVKGTPPVKERLDINETILEAIAFTPNELERHRILLQTKLASDLPPVPGDRVQLQQVILNLLVNAIEVMRDVSERERQLLVSSRKHDSDSVLVAVQDSGTGLDPANLESVFEAFHTTKPNGMGMGLAISRSIVNAHGGRLWATNSETGGAVFQFTLPTVGSATAPSEEATR